MLESALLVECKDATATILFVTVVAAALGMLLVTTTMLSLLKMVSELVGLCCKDPDFFFKDGEVALLEAVSSLRRGD